VIWHISTVIVVGLMFAGAAEAGARRARLSSDLSSRLTPAANGAFDVIVTGSVEKIDRLAQRPGLRIKEQLESGAVLVAFGADRSS